MAYRIYVSDALKAISGNTASMVPGTQFSEVSVMQERYYEVIRKPKDTRSAQEIISDIGDKLDMMGKEE